MTTLNGRRRWQHNGWTEYRAEYLAWAGARIRTTNPHDPAWKDYGGRGITMAPEWLDDFDAFLDHIGPKPDPSLTLDRIDNSMGYIPGNVRWATRSEQSSNQRRRPIRVEHGSRSMYVHHKCRCDPCRAANAAASRRPRRQRKDVEVRTLIRRGAPDHSAGVLRGEKQAWDGAIEQAGVAAVAPSRITTPLAGEGPPDCRYCGDSGVIVYEDEAHLCPWCKP